MYTELTIKFSPFTEEYSDIIIALLGEIEYESFTTSQNLIKAYISSKNFNFELAKETLNVLKEISVDLSFENIEKQNWNALWESNFKPVFIGKDCIIHAPFHSDLPKVKYEIVIEPKMSFGTGHHETTSLVTEYVLQIDFTNKTVLDMGCGTGVLAILASMRNAKEVTAIDYDEWSYLNTVENFERNNITNFKAWHGDFDSIHGLKFDIVLANINRNILSDHAQDLYNVTNENGEIYMSGFYNIDLEIIKNIYEKVGFKYVSFIEKNNWVSTKLVKN